MQTLTLSHQLGTVLCVTANLAGDVADGSNSVVPVMSAEAPLFDHLVGEGQQCRGNFQAERLSRLEIEHQLEFGWLLDRQIAGLGALEDLVDEQPLSTEH